MREGSASLAIVLDVNSNEGDLVELLSDRGINLRVDLSTEEDPILEFLQSSDNYGIPMIVLMDDPAVPFDDTETKSFFDHKPRPKLKPPRTFAGRSSRAQWSGYKRN